MQSAIGSAKVISAATNADPGVFTSNAHGFNDGDVILLVTEGMTEVNGRAFVVDNKTTNTYELQDVDGVSSIDTTGFGVFTSGSAYLITLGTSITGVSSFAPSGGESKFLDTTTVMDSDDKQIVAGSTAMSYALTFQWDPNDVAQKAMRTAFEVAGERVFKIKWPNGTFVLFNGTVGFNGAPGGDNQGITTTQGAVAVSGKPTYGK